MKGISRFFVLLPLLVLCFGCIGPKHMIKVSEIAPAINLISDRHDQYVSHDSALSDTEKEVYLKTTEGLRKVIAEASK